MSLDAASIPVGSPMTSTGRPAAAPNRVTVTIGSALGMAIGVVAGQQFALRLLKTFAVDERYEWLVWPVAAVCGVAGLRLAAQAVARDFRYLMPLLITGILAGAQMGFGVLESIPQTLTAIATSIICELILSKWIRGVWPSLVSAYISGISVGILLRSPEIWPYAVCAAIAIVSKYAIRVRGRHIWNPSNLSVTAMLVLYPGVVTSLNHQWGNYEPVLLLIWALGAFIVGRLHRFHICLAYVLTFIAMAAPRAMILGWGPITGAGSAGDAAATFWEKYLVEFAPLTGPMYQLFTFFMVTDPPTTVRTYRGQILVAVLVGVVEAAIRLLPVYGEVLGLSQADAGLIASKAPYLALFLVGPVTNLIEIFYFSPASATPSGRPATAVAAA